MDKFKVFGIGLSRTGTTSLTRALGSLGWRGLHYPVPQNAANVLRLAEQYDALTDTPVIPVYKILAERYSDARFVLTVRHISEWLDSCRSHFGGSDSARGGKRACRIAVFGVPMFVEEAFRETYRRHLHDVRGYFNSQRERLLIMNLCGGQGWETLCPFLGVPVPDDPFPHTNQKQ
jgi:hypothetical protein